MCFIVLYHKAVFSFCAVLSLVFWYKQRAPCTNFLWEASMYIDPLGFILIDIWLFSPEVPGEMSCFHYSEWLSRRSKPPRYYQPSSHVPETNGIAGILITSTWKSLTPFRRINRDQTYKYSANSVIDIINISIYLLIYNRYINKYVLNDPLNFFP